MPGNFKREDLRVLKTRKVLLSAMTGLLKCRNFNDITVHDLCEAAMISRTTFYAHFVDKYDLLKYWLADVQAKMAYQVEVYPDLENSINALANQNKKVIRHLIENANPETGSLLCDFICSVLHIDKGKINHELASPRKVVFSNFCCGGVLNYLLWQVENKFPDDLQVMNEYLFEILSHFPQDVAEEPDGGFE